MDFKATTSVFPYQWLAIGFWSEPRKTITIRYQVRPTSISVLVTPGFSSLNCSHRMESHKVRSAFRSHSRVNVRLSGHKTIQLMYSAGKWGNDLTLTVVP